MAFTNWPCVDREQYFRDVNAACNVVPDSQPLSRSDPSSSSKAEFTVRDMLRPVANQRGEANGASNPGRKRRRGRQYHNCLFKGKRNSVLPTSSTARLLNHLGWNLTKSDNHWSTLATMKEWVNLILKQYYIKICQERGLDMKTQKLMLVLDCWSVHKSAAFHSWLEETHTWIALLFVPAGCTSKFQPCDVIVQRPLKDAFRKEFQGWCVREISNMLTESSSPEDIKMDFSISTLRKLACDSLFSAHNQVASKKEMIRCGWRKCGLLQAWEHEHQLRAVEENATGSLFNSTHETDNVEERADLGTDDECGDASVQEIMERVVGPTLQASNVNDTAMTENTVRLHDFRNRPVPVGSQSRSRFTQYLSEINIVTPYV
ncbi:hypothetical protein R1sor_020873 [Riccia sorocarpa]|uniref:DDE-1 domain-containing protein n=1 Tax=Riccia sorocarpa TaxID=122646 RepID=A0ABD3GIB4_9MARC